MAGRRNMRLPEARPGAVQDAAMARRTAPVLPSKGARHKLKRRVDRRAVPSICSGGKEREGGLPGASNNTGDESRR